jgi:lipopolysaccharide/colanic/teichoic acid biosynthesis glycosyltransferase
MTVLAPQVRDWRADGSVTEEVTAPSKPLPSERAHRIISVVVASIGIMLTAPLMAAIAVVIRLTSRGPILYSQSRIGQDRRGLGEYGNGRRQLDLGGRPFRIYKFRSMFETAQGKSDAVWASPNDDRVTPVGRVLRKYRLDELPQLFNVVKGDMNIVGPRPEQPKIFAQLRENIDRYQERQRVPPGITGWAQINQHYDSSFEDVKQKVTFDLEYIERRSAVEDLKIMLQTVPVIVLQKGAW